MRRVLAAVLLVFLGLLWGSVAGSAAARAVPPAEVVVQDDAGVLDRNRLVPAVEALEFYEPTRVAVYTYRGSADANLNEEVLRFARASHPEWISADGQKWADGLFIFALDPVGRHVGTYMGEDRKVSLEQREDIQNASKDLFRDAQWTDGTIAGIRRGAELINQPWYRSTAFLAAAWSSVAAAVLGAGTWLIVRWRTRVDSRRELARGDASYANVSMDLQVTELNAGTIPESSRYGSTVLEKHRSFMAKYNAATGLSNQAHALTPRAMSRRPNLKLIRRFADAAAELDALDDVIADTNALLNRGRRGHRRGTGNWRRSAVTWPASSRCSLSGTPRATQRRPQPCGPSASRVSGRWSAGRQSLPTAPSPPKRPWTGCVTHGRT